MYLRRYRRLGRTKSRYTIHGIPRQLTTTQVQSQEIIRGEVKSAFGIAAINENAVSSTRDLLSGLTRFPEDANPYSLRNVMQHAEDVMGADLFDDFMEKLIDKTPIEASELIAEQIVLLERKAIKEGGTKVTGEFLEGTRRERRTSSIQARLGQDARWAEGIAKGIDAAVNMFPTKYLNKIEPMIVRPMTISYLAFGA